MRAWRPDPARESCIRRYGHMRQLCGIRRCVYTQGNAAGTEAFEIDTGGGLRFTVLPGRGMDIASFQYRGVPVSYLTKGDISSAFRYDPQGDGWLKNFFGGMLTTCGLTNAGPACRGNLGILRDVPLGLHGGISNACADDVSSREEWTEQGYALTVSGRMEEGRLHGEHLGLRRTIETALGEKRIVVTDEFTNLGEEEQMLMFFYHINIGHPVLDAASRFYAPCRSVSASTERAREEIDQYDRMGAPRPGYLEQQFFLEMLGDEENIATCALINAEMELGVYFRYNVSELPRFALWKVLRDAEYVTAFEPGNCHAVGREEQIRRGAEYLKPMQTRRARFEIGIVDGKEEIEAIIKTTEARA